MSAGHYQKKRKKQDHRTKRIKCFVLVIVLVLCVVLGVIVAKEFISQNEGDNSQEEMTEQGTEEPQKMELTERADGSYERWLAAAMVVAVSMQYTDFEIDNIYLTGETDLSDFVGSSGAYVVYTADGVQAAVHSVPLEAERTEPGTRDLYTADLGFATYDAVELEEIDTDSCVEVTMDDLEELISQSLLISLYEH